MPFFEPPDDPQKDGDDFLPFLVPPDDEPRMDDRPDFLPFFEPDVDALDAVCENGGSSTLSTTYRLPQLRLRFFWSGDSFALPVLTSTSLVSFFPVSQLRRLIL